MRIGSLRGAPFCFYTALGFLLWSVLPHFSAYVHVHPDEDAGHSHRNLSKSQVELAQRLAESAGEAFGEEALSPSFGLSEANAEGCPPLPAGHAALSAAAELLHGHFQEDANSTVTPWSGGSRVVQVPPRAVPPFFPSHPLRSPVHEIRVRGPPVFPS